MSILEWEGMGTLLVATIGVLISRSIHVIVNSERTKMEARLTRLEDRNDKLTEQNDLLIGLVKQRNGDARA